MWQNFRISHFEQNILNIYIFHAYSDGVIPKRKSSCPQKDSVNPRDNVLQIICKWFIKSSQGYICYISFENAVLLVYYYAFIIHTVI